MQTCNSLCYHLLAKCTIYSYLFFIFFYNLRHLLFYKQKCFAIFFSCPVYTYMPFWQLMRHDHAWQMILARILAGTYHVCFHVLRLFLLEPKKTFFPHAKIIIFTSAVEKLKNIIYFYFFLNREFKIVNKYNFFCIIHVVNEI